jgi:hypothetical protein
LRPEDVADFFKEFEDKEFPENKLKKAQEAENQKMMAQKYEKLMTQYRLLKQQTESLARDL